MPGVTIHTIPLGFDQCYLLCGEGVVLVDTGAPNKRAAFERALKRFHIFPEEIRLILITHGHWDHIGSARAIKEFTGAPLAMHAHDARWLQEATTPLPAGVTPWGKAFMAVHRLFMPLIRVEAVTPDILLDEKEFSLHPFGIPGMVLHTPGHSAGSMSVLLDSGEAFVGDLAMNRLPLRNSPGPAIFGDDPALMTESLRELVGRGAKTFYPAHGKPFPAEMILG